MPTKLTIGGKEYTTVVMSLEAVRKALPLLDDMRAVQRKLTAGFNALTAGDDDIRLDPEALDKSFAINLEIVSLALAGSENEADRLTPDQINKQGKATELKGLQAAIRPILVENELRPEEVTPGEVLAPAAAPAPAPAPKANRARRRAEASTSKSSTT